MRLVFIGVLVALLFLAFETYFDLEVGFPLVFVNTFAILGVLSLLPRSITHGIKIE
jgi:hypothetical protein